MYESGQQISKLPVEVQVQLNDGSRFLGVLALSQGQRVSDLMNDERQFLPIKLPSGSVVILRKTMIAKVAPLDQHIDRERISDPHEILGVSRTISDEDLKRFYHALCSENHPDRVQSSGLSSEFVELANSRMIRINDAYKRILAMRHAKGANGQGGLPEPDPFG